MENIGGNAIVIRQVNENLVRKVLKEKELATKRQIAEATGLSIVTVGTVLQHLMRKNEVREIGVAASSGGRPARQYKYNLDYALALILFPVEREGSIYIHTTVVNLAGDCVHETDVKVEHINLFSFEQIIDKSIHEFPSIEAIGFGLPGAEFEGKMIVSDYKDLLGMEVAEHFRNRYQKPITIENDVNAAVIGFANRMQLAADSSIVYLFFPERFPPGAGIYLNGQLYKGRRNFAGEVANIPLGINWIETSLLTTFDLLCDAISKLTVAISSVLNPDSVVLYGNFLNQGHINAVIQKSKAQLPQSVLPTILLSDNFEADYLQGMIVQTLSTLTPNLQLTK
ncbi:ROK family protein [Alicyclobacillus fastidiosus]|uniref:ROK family protein n=1 Tax=Alicyclobacillus fastidiosus TaxID=392011 RepID=A0ABV5AI70_9BACL|nr:ROK family protein [Alicyclobacillus fastidiosus]WEH11570.1 ROK family protein [Alicyclobacillus fastidiosus]